MAGRKAEKLLERMRKSKSGWSSQDLIRLYRGFGFEIRNGSSHDVITHPAYPYSPADFTSQAEELYSIR